MAESAIDTNTQVMSPQSSQQSAAVPAPRPEQASQDIANAPVRTPIVTSILNQPGVQRTLPAIVVLFSLAALALIYSYVSAPAARPVFTDLSDADRQVAYDALLAAGNYGAYLDKSTGLLMIPENEYFDAKIFLASQGIPRSAQGGGFDELLANAMTRSRNMEAAQLKEFDERELKETIEAIYAVKSAKVQIARPQQSVFVKDREPAKASVSKEFPEVLNSVSGVAPTIKPRLG